MTIEVERYELLEDPRYRFEFDRRDFIKTFGGGLLVLLVSPRLDGQESGRGRGADDRLPADVNAWLHIAATGAVTAFTGKVEVGQNIRTSLTQAVAEELHVPLESVSLVMGDTSRVPFDMGTFGSRTTPTMNLQLRRVAAAARSALATRAADRWQVSADAIDVVDGRVIHKASNRSTTLGGLLTDQPLVATVTEDVTLADPAAWRVAGRSVPKVDGRSFVTGTHEYTSDIRRPGMGHGRVIRPPKYGATISSVDASAAQAQPGVLVVRDGDFLGVVADTTEGAARAADLVKVTWAGGGTQSSRTLFGDLKSSAEPGDGQGAFHAGDVESALASASHRFEGSYHVAYIAHCPLEPRAAVAEWDGSELTVWTGTQRPFGVRGELAEAFHLLPERVRVMMPDTGSGYGGKHTGEAAIEAARLARGAKRPVSLVWTRAEELTWAYFRPAGVIDVRAAVDASGTITAWEFHNYNSGPSGIRSPYAIPNQRVEFHAATSPLRQGSYRGLAATANHFAREAHMDEMAAALHVDPLAFRQKHLRDDRIAAVLEAAATKFGWRSRTRASGRGYGLACGTEKGGYVATCAEVAIDGRDVRVVRVAAAFECGAIVNPDGLKNQVEGAVIQGLGGALFETVSFDDGRVVNARFADYRVPRFGDLPAIEVVLVNRPDLPSAGAGETPIVGIAPALAGAIFDATGVRLRALPLVPDGLPAAPSSASADTGTTPPAAPRRRP
jgi:CO/xanthine dehydrogenase Mo-binding subunit